MEIGGFGTADCNSENSADRYEHSDYGHMYFYYAANAP